MSAYDQAKGQLGALRAAFEATPCDLQKCEELLGQVKLLVFSGLQSSGALAAAGSGADAAKEQALARETLELACFLSIKRQDLAGFERHMAQLKTYYNDHKTAETPPQKFAILGLYLLHLLASDRIGDFHTELELIPVDDYNNMHINAPIQLERYLMEGNYLKVLEAKTGMHEYSKFFMDRLLETVRLKVGASLEQTYESLPLQQASKMLILNDVAELQKFAIRENERKEREASDDDNMGDMTPSLKRRTQVGTIRWEVKEGRLFFSRSAEKRLEIPALELMVNTIGYATDLERIV